MIEEDGLPPARRWRSMTAIGIGVSMSVLDTAITTIALPTIARELHVSSAASVLVVNAYQLAIVTTLLPLAALGARYGYRRVYEVGLVVFTLGSLGCALSRSLALLVVARAVQGLGASALMAMDDALVRYTYPRAQLGRAYGVNALVVAVSAAIGPTLGAAILAVASWQWIFAINVPLGALNIWLALRSLPDTDRSGDKVDWRGALLAVATFGLIFIGADAFRVHMMGRIGAVAVAAGVATGLVLVMRAARQTRPLMPVDLFADRTFAFSILASVCAFGAYLLAFLALPFLFIGVLHRGEVEMGLLITPCPVVLVVVAPLAGRLSDQMSGALLGGVGLSIMAAGLAALATLGPDSSNLAIVWRIALCGLGFGLFQAPNNRMILASAPRERAGAAGGMSATARLVGMASGATIAAFAFTFMAREAETIGLLAAAALAGLGAVASLARLTPA